MMLQEQDATWNAAKNCNVVTTPLSPNEKKVILYSANLQVRGGFGDEMIRRKATVEFIECLQKEPYNMNQAEAKKALKEISGAVGRTIDKDIRIEHTLNKQLLQLLDEKYLTRNEGEELTRLDQEQQQRIGSLFEELFAIENPEVKDLQDEIKNEAMAGLESVWGGSSTEERDQRFEDVLADMKARIEKLTVKEKEESDAETEKQAALEREIKTAEKKAETKTFVQKTLQPLAGKIGKKIATPAYKRGLKKISRKQRAEDIKTLDELIKKAAELKELLETVE